jgi:hypothetical protein
LSLAKKALTCSVALALPLAMRVDPHRTDQSYDPTRLCLARFSRFTSPGYGYRPFGADPEGFQRFQPLMVSSDLIGFTLDRAWPYRFPLRPGGGHLTG